MMLGAWPSMKPSKDSEQSFYEENIAGRALRPRKGPSLQETAPLVLQTPALKFTFPPQQKK